MEKIDLTEMSEFLIGQAQDETAMTGCTAIIAPQGAVCGVDVCGGSPGTRDTDALNPLCNRKEVHAVLLSGGSSFGLDAAGGLMGLLEERKIGRDVGITVVPNVCSAILFDLKCGNYKIRPDSAMGRKAGENAFMKLPFQSENFGAGTGATIGKSAGLKNAMKGGIGAAAFRHGYLTAAAVFAVNCVGDIIENGQIIAGARLNNSLDFADSETVILNSYADEKDFFQREHGNRLYYNQCVSYKTAGCTACLKRTKCDCTNCTPRSFRFRWRHRFCALQRKSTCLA